MPSSTSHNPNILPEAGQPLCAAPPAQGPVCRELLLQTACPRVASADVGWGSQPGGAELQKGHDLPRWPLGFAGDWHWLQPPGLGTGTSCNPPNWGPAPQGGAAPAHLCADVPHFGERRTRANPPREASGPSPHTYFLQPYSSLCCHNTAQPRLSQTQQLSFSPATPASASLTTKAMGIFLRYLISA